MSFEKIMSFEKKKEIHKKYGNVFRKKRECHLKKTTENVIQIK